MPNSTSPIGNITVTTYAIYSGVNYIVNTRSEANLFEASAGSILVPTITANSYATYETTTYNISFTVNNPIQTGGTVEVTFPTEVSIVNTTASQST